MQTLRSRHSLVRSSLLSSAALFRAPSAESPRVSKPADNFDIPGRRKKKHHKHGSPPKDGPAGAGVYAAIVRQRLLASLGAQVALEGSYPKTPRGNVVDDYHGVKVADPYRALETKDATTVAWAEEQNTFTRQHLDKLPARQLVIDWMKASLSVGEKSRARVKGDFTFWTERKGGEEQASLYVKSKNGKPRLLLNPVAHDPTATLHIGGYSPSPDGKNVAVAVHDNGSDWATWYIFDSASGEMQAEVLPWTKTDSIEWTPDGKGFYYSGLPVPQPGKELQEAVHDMEARYHKLGTPQSADVVIAKTPENPDMTHDLSLSEDDSLLVLSSGDLRKGSGRIAVRAADAPINAPFRTVLETREDQWQPVGGDGTVTYFMTDRGAPNGRLVALDLAAEKPVIRELLPEDAQMTLDGAVVVGERVYARYLNNGTSALKVFHKGSLERTIALPDRGTVSAFWGDKDGKNIQFDFQNFYTPTIEYAVEESGKLRITKPSRIGINPADYVTTESFYESTDGTQVPVFITQRRDVPRDGNAPTLQYAYGGFRADVTPTYSRRFHAWLELGGIVAVPQLRGGREFGENWHKGGNLARKQNVFEDFKQAARHLVKQRYTNPKRLVLAGASNGGLLVAATVLQDTSIAAAGLVGVGVHDLLRYHLWTWGPGWIPEYGVSSDPMQFPYLYANSPVHNVRDGAQLPALLVETGTSDDRVEPGHSYKLIAALQAAQAGKAPVLLRVDKDTGHGAGKPIGKVIDQTADEIAFALNAMDANSYAANLQRSMKRMAA